jgi:NAD(P)-dependent dehydrogenase (short-subunit alcohol dehydrogenase family)
MGFSISDSYRRGHAGEVNIIAESGCYLIAGGSGRIGRSVAQRLLSEGENVVAVDVGLGQEHESATNSDAKYFFIRANIADPSTIRDVVSKAVERFGHIKGAVHAAYPKSKDWGAPFEALDQSSLRENLFAQLGGTIFFAREVAMEMKLQAVGSIVLLSSIQGVRAPRFAHYEGLGMTSPAEYSAIKAGVIGFTKWLAKYMAESNVRVNCVSPGGILSDQHEEFRERYRQDCLSKGLLDPEDVVGAIRFLLSEDSRYMSGQNLIIDDGWSL